MGNSIKSERKATEPEDNVTAEETSKKENKELKQVKEKLSKANKGRSKKGKNELQDLAEKLIDKEKTKREFFSHLLVYTETARKVASEEHQAFPEGFPNKFTKVDSEQRMAEPFEQVRKLEVKLMLHELKDAHLVQQVANFVHNYVTSFTFGPFHAAILIGDVLLEWRPNSLVIPRKIKHEVLIKDEKAVLFTNLHEQEDFPTVPLQYENGTDEETVASSFENIIDITRVKEQLIDELADVVVRYNTKMHYGIFTSNCQHFVKDVLTILGITDPEKAFRGRLKNHADLVMARYTRNSEAITEFNSHEELDSHIREQNIDEMSRDDLEFAYCHYLLFHAWGQRFPYVDAWRCNTSECQARLVAKKVQ